MKRIRFQNKPNHPRGEDKPIPDGDPTTHKRGKDKPNHPKSGPKSGDQYNNRQCLTSKMTQIRARSQPGIPGESQASLERDQDTVESLCRFQLA